MSKNSRAVLGAVALVLALAGCSSQAKPAEPAQAVSTVAAAPTAASNPVSTADANDAAFVQKIRVLNPEMTYTDSELIAYGVIACAQLQSGSEATAIKVLPETDTDYVNNNSTIVGVAKLMLCP